MLQQLVLTLLRVIGMHRTLMQTKELEITGQGLALGAEYLCWTVTHTNLSKTDINYIILYTQFSYFVKLSVNILALGANWDQNSLDKNHASTIIELCLKTVEFYTTGI